MLKNLHQLFVKSIILALAVGVIIYDTITFPLYLFLQKPWRKWKKMFRKRSVVTWKKDCLLVDSLDIPPAHYLDDCKTLNDALDRTIEVNGRDKQCLGYREVISAEPSDELVDGKKLIKYELSDYKWIHFGMFYDMLLSFAHSLRLLGVNKADKVVVYADTCANWFISAQGIIRNGSVLTTLYSSLGEQGSILNSN